jgi:hypothetical protein
MAALPCACPCPSSISDLAEGGTIFVHTISVTKQAAQGGRSSEDAKQSTCPAAQRACPSNSYAQQLAGHSRVPPGWGRRAPWCWGTSWPATCPAATHTAHSKRWPGWPTLARPPSELNAGPLKPDLQSCRAPRQLAAQPVTAQRPPSRQVQQLEGMPCQLNIHRVQHQPWTITHPPTHPPAQVSTHLPTTHSFTLELFFWALPRGPLPRRSKKPAMSSGSRSMASREGCMREAATGQFHKFDVSKIRFLNV